MEVEYSVQSVQDQVTPSRHNDATSLPAPTRAMSISELRWNIFQMVDAGSYARNMTLLALALTCKSFTEPALDLLWRELHGLSPLIRCLPSSLWKLNGPKPHLNFMRSMTLDDWSIFCKYNHRIQALHITYPGGHIIGPEIWYTLNRAPFPLPLLPNLISLGWSDDRSEQFPYIQLFVTHKLMTLKIQTSFFEDLDLSKRSILTCIPILYPSASYFVGDTDPRDASIALHCGPHLSLDAGLISEANLLYISHLRSLRVLTLHLPWAPIASDTQNLLQHSAFCALQELHVACHGLAPLGAFLETLTIAPKVLSFTIYEGEDSSWALMALISRLSKVRAHSALEHLQVGIDSVMVGTSISAATFEPLYAFRNLRKLDFSSGYDVELDDAILLQMTKTWPLLEIFSITGKYTHAVTANAFVSLLQHCPRLTSVGITVDWSAVDRREISSGILCRGFTHTALSRADFSYSRIHHVITIAAFISAIAPKLVDIVAWPYVFSDADPDFGKYYPRWEVVQRLVKSFSIVREQEREKILNAGGAVGGDAIGSGKDSEDYSGGESDISFPSDSSDEE
ncbi:hypothetical protein K503DRAFT_870818 [Rhizopogon vinicolor AM-OR11-026]|uniref:F-box domain-containing protein n=1 Tax=Rhizopogon vinicolor AM-OR11-026 TaxID=1314800 RepID=A0A1B7MEC6_9AGAM|nr:hypothetical protein K503DRAFT_870818 [Rhizopogon vinicolor AM-OR11-026]